MRRQRTDDLIRLLAHDYTYAATRATCAEAMGLTRGQFDYLLHDNPEATEAWTTARRKVRADRCATRRCSMCRQTKPRQEFPQDRRDGCGIGRRCKRCHRLVMRARRAGQ